MAFTWQTPGTTTARMLAQLGATSPALRRRRVSAGNDEAKHWTIAAASLSCWGFSKTLLLPCTEKLLVEPDDPRLAAVRKRCCSEGFVSCFCQANYWPGSCHSPPRSSNTCHRPEPFLHRGSLDARPGVVHAQHGRVGQCNGII